MAVASKTNAELVVVPVATWEVKVCEPVPELKARAVVDVALPTVRVFAFADVPIFMAPVVAESIFNAPDELLIECAAPPIFTILPDELT